MLIGFHPASEVAPAPTAGNVVPGCPDRRQVLTVKVDLAAEARNTAVGRIHWTQTQPKFRRRRW